MSKEFNITYQQKMKLETEPWLNTKRRVYMVTKKKNAYVLYMSKGSSMRYGAKLKWIGSVNEETIAFKRKKTISEIVYLIFLIPMLAIGILFWGAIGMGMVQGSMMPIEGLLGALGLIAFDVLLLLLYIKSYVKGEEQELAEFMEQL